MSPGAFLLLALFVPLIALADTTAIVGGTIALGDGSAPILNGTVVMRDDRIVSAGTDVRVPQGASVVDARGKWVSPGLIAPFTQLGIGSFSRVAELNDSTATESPFSAALDVSTAINPEDAPIQVSRAEGITRAVVLPFAGKTIFGGQGAVIELSKRLDVITRPRAFQYVELGATADHLAGGSRPAAYAYLVAPLADRGGGARAIEPASIADDRVEGHGTNLSVSRRHDDHTSTSPSAVDRYAKVSTSDRCSIRRGIR